LHPKYIKKNKKQTHKYLYTLKKKKNLCKIYFETVFTQKLPVNKYKETASYALH